MSSKNNVKKLSLMALILMIFTSVYGFNNMPRSYYLMGYGAIPFYIISAIIFFIPFAFMMAEYGAAFRNEKGGIYSWMEKSVGPRYAFVGTFMWYASAVIWMVNTSSGLWIPISNAIFGSDTTSTWSLFGLSSTQTLGILGVLWIIFVCFISTKGLDKIKKVTSIGGTAVALLNLVLLFGAIAVLIGNKGQLAEPIVNAASFIKSPNPAYASTISMFSFLVYAIFAFGGIEVVGGLVDQTENPEKNFPKGIAVAAIIIAIGYAVGIFCIGIFTNWAQVLSPDTVHKANVGYVVMNNLGYQIGMAFGASQQVAIQIGNWIARFVGLSMLLALTGAFFTMTYAPLKQLIEGSPKGLFPEKFAKLNNGIPVNAMIVQATVVIVIILLVSFGGKSVSKFFDVLVAMTNIAMTVPYMFLSAAFIFFKRKEEIQKPFEIFKGKTFPIVVSVIVTATVGFANVFSIIEPAMNGDIATTIWSIAGPIIFSVVALLMFRRYEKNKSI
ncbi:Amino acid transporter [Clostridium collagenovorans DSM 3089]|uniref:Amino acid transporter n=1 Tax=Clostridium collagenovorans DSM 3089 TaxID=1121306 RepID=A0A1M5TAC5_9CLOT|nr:glutamate/gamma-aminobutyrate family transporter YjeM [Clostridium collagenovorans]SHH47682.1 Amino acid transporter [Clostridium collagenovorans DSM 3089]